MTVTLRLLMCVCMCLPGLEHLNQTTASRRPQHPIFTAPLLKPSPIAEDTSLIFSRHPFLHYGIPGGDVELEGQCILL